MPSLAFGLKSSQPRLGPSKPAVKRKAAFDESNSDDGQDDGFANLTKGAAKGSKLKLKPIVDNDQDSDFEGPPKSPKVAHASAKASSTAPLRTNLSTLRSTKLQDQAASQLDSSVYDYDAVYDTFRAVPSDQQTVNTASGPKYMTSLLKSSETRKRDLLRAKEKLLQKERENEGDEFADKEKFVTGAYKKQQEEMRKLEEEEKRLEEEEDARRRKGGGMTDFNKKVLAKEEARAKQAEAALEEIKKKREAGDQLNESIKVDTAEEDERRTAEKLNQEGARIVVNDEGEVVDKRQLLGAGLNVAPKRKTDSAASDSRAEYDKPKEWHRSSKQHDARMSQRERQTKMMERQIEEMSQQQEQAEMKEEQQNTEKNKSRVTDETKMSAKERFLQRKREREQEAKASKSNG